MNVTVKFQKKINHKSTFYPHGHWRTMKTKIYRMDSQPDLSTTLTIDGDKYLVVQHSIEYNRGKNGKHIIGVEKIESK